MAYYLNHLFDPDFDYTQLTPKENEDGSVDHYDLNYVQNVVAGQVLAEWQEIEDEDRSQLDPRFIYDEKDFPAGRGTGIKHSDPNRLFAAQDGYVLYLEGKITVRKTLNVRRDVDFHTGNISFVSNVVVYGAVRTGFCLEAKEIEILGIVEGAQVRALSNVSCPAGVKGGGDALIEAGHSAKLAFCEGATVKAGDNVMVKGAMMHSRVFAGKRLAVGSRLQGTRVYCRDYVYVGEQLGGGIDSETVIVLGYHPSLLYADKELDYHLHLIHDEIQLCTAKVERGQDVDGEYRQRLREAEERLKGLQARKQGLWEKILRTENLADCKVLVPGVVKPGVEISIGRAFLKVDDFYEDVYFYYEDDEVKIGKVAKRA